MSKNDSVPTRLEELAGFRLDCSCGRRHQVDLQGVELGRGVLERLVHWVRKIGPGTKLCLVDDARTHEIAGARAAKLVEADGHDMVHCLLPDGRGGRPHADDATLKLVLDAMKGCDAAVAVGSGTVNDLTKLASYRLGIPYLVVATAPSMNGYTSAIAAITQAGLKVTVECHQPLAAIADLDIICSAPAELVAAGVGDLESKPTATADFRLAGWLRGEYWCPLPERVVFDAEKKVADAAGGIGKGDPDAIMVLMEALLLSGISMKLAGSSAPASGAEHLISHYWDMTASSEGRVEGWHGAQVGVATIVSAGLYEYLRCLDPSEVDPDELLRKRPDRVDDGQLKALHGSWWKLARKELDEKTLSGQAYAEELAKVLQGWERMWSHLEPALRPAAGIRQTLDGAGAPTSIWQLGLTGEQLGRAYVAARQIRARFTVLDLCAELGLLEKAKDEVCGLVK